MGFMPQETCEKGSCHLHWNKYSSSMHIIVRFLIWRLHTYWNLSKRLWKKRLQVINWSYRLHKFGGNVCIFNMCTITMHGDHSCQVGLIFALWFLRRKLKHNKLKMEDGCQVT